MKDLEFKSDELFQSSERCRDDFNKIRCEIQNISGKPDAFTVLRQETAEDEGKFPKLVNKGRPKRSTKTQ